jgi:hypothetical protein
VLCAARPERLSLALMEPAWIGNDERGRVLYAS